MPKEKQIEPKYGQKSFAKELQKNELVLVASGFGRGNSLQINQDVEIFIGKFSQEESFEFKPKNGKKIWIQIVAGKVLVNGEKAEKGDGIAIENEEVLKITAKEKSEFLLFDL